VEKNRKIRKKGKLVTPNKCVWGVAFRNPVAHPALDGRDRVLGQPTAGTMAARRSGMAGRPWVHEGTAWGRVRGQRGSVRGQRGDVRGWHGDM